MVNLSVTETTSGRRGLLGSQRVQPIMTDSWWLEWIGPRQQEASLCYAPTRKQRWTSPSSLTLSPPLLPGRLQSQRLHNLPQGGGDMCHSHHILQLVMQILVKLGHDSCANHLDFSDRMFHWLRTCWPMNFRDLPASSSPALKLQAQANMSGPLEHGLGVTYFQGKHFIDQLLFQLWS